MLGSRKDGWVNWVEDLHYVRSPPAVNRLLRQLPCCGHVAAAGGLPSLSVPDLRG